MAAITICNDFGAQENQICHCFLFPPSICHEVKKWKWSRSVVPSSLQPHGSAIHGIFQARVLEWAAISFFRGSSQPMDQTQVSCIADRSFTVWTTRETYLHIKCLRDFFWVLWIYSLILELLTSVPARIQGRSHWNAGKRKLCSRSLGRRKGGKYPKPFSVLSSSSFISWTWTENYAETCYSQIAFWVCRGLVCFPCVFSHTSLQTWNTHPHLFQKAMFLFAHP